MKRYLRRSACAGFMRVCNAVKDGSTMSYWYYLKVGTAWYPFDIRELAKRAKQPGPVLTPQSDLIQALQDRDTVKYESLLQKDLNTICSWCMKVSAQDFLERVK
jgi:hypothetical protein